jgi:phosphofructokinase-like protein
MKRIGVLTGGGDCPGLNAVIRAAVKTGVGSHNLELVGIESGFEGLIDLKTSQLTHEMVRGILPKGGTVLRTSNRGNPFEFPSRTRPGEIEDISDQVVSNIKQLGLEALLVIGGDGTLKIAQRLFERGVPVVGVPKTIDNDIAATDVTFGFMTAVDIATEAVDRLHSTAESHNRIMILEVMGRNAGWIALYSGIAGGADIILLPEIPYRTTDIINAIETRRARGSMFDIIVVAEGAKREGGEEVYQEKKSRRLGGVAFQVAEDIRERVDLELRVTVLGHVQRGGSPIPFDRILATRFGKAAIDLLADRNFGMMVALHRDEITAVRIRDAISRPKLVQADNELVETARAMGISFGHVL